MKLRDYFPKELMIFLLVAILTIIVFSFALFGITGIKVVFGIILMWLPFYLILNHFDIALGERFVFSLILGVTLFPSLVFLIGFLIPFRMAIIVTFLLLIGVFFLVRKFKKK